MPKFGQMAEQGTIVEWLKKEGDPVAKGDILFTVETDKSVMEMESFEAGTLLKILVQPGVPVPVQTAVGYLGQPGEAIPVPASAGGEPAGAAPAPAAGETKPAQDHETRAGPERVKISPRAAALAREHGLDVSRIAGSGPGGRIVEKDVQARLEARAEEEPKPLSRMRQVIAERLTHSFRDIPHFYVTVSADVTDLIAYRDQLKAAGAPYTLTDFVARASVLALQEFPVVNSSTDGATARAHRHVNLGIAVSLDEGLVVPVIREAEGLSLGDLSRLSRALVEKARARKATPDDLSGGTFTLTNMGMLDVESFCAIINPGESAILAVASAQAQPVVRGGAVAIRQMMKLTLSCDHRLVDGALGARFLNAVKRKLEDIGLWKAACAK